MMTKTLKEMGYQQITTLSSAVGLTVPAAASRDVGSDGQSVSFAGRAKYAFIQAETQAVRWRADGTSPTTTVGHRLLPGESLFYDGNILAIKFIEETASAKLNVSYYA